MKKSRNVENDGEIIEKFVRWCAVELKITNFNHNFVKNFVVGCNYDEEKCQKKLKDYFFYKKIYPRYFQAGSLTDEKFNSFCNSVFSLYLPVLTKEDYKIFIDKVTDDEKLFDVGMIMQYFSMQTDLRYLKEGPDKGDIILFDCNHVNLFNFMAFLPFFIKSLSIILKIYPLNLKKLILINTGEVMASILTFVKYFLSKEHKQMIHFHADGTDKFLLHVQADLLPSDYAGKLPSLKEMRGDLIRRLDSNREWFRSTNNMVNLSTYHFFHEEDIAQGFTGSFKQLLID